MIMMIMAVFLKVPLLNYCCLIMINFLTKINLEQLKENMIHHLFGASLLFMFIEILHFKFIF